MSFLYNLMSSFNFPVFSKPNLDLFAVIDILAVAYISYQMLLWIKETRAWSLFKGIVVIAIIYIISAIFNLYTLSWIISNTVAYGLIALVVVFQPEVRKALETLGKGNFKFLTPAETENHQMSESTVNEIITACVKMSRERTGAIIAIEAKVALGDLESSGIPIDALVSSQLLINIFEDKTPLHDGAVIIRGNRIAAATCILPLTQTSISADLGTRHRAAIGASEDSDAHILVVSEETGIISLAHGGHLYRKLTEEDIRNMILGNGNPTKRKRGLWKGRQST